MGELLTAAALRGTTRLLVMQPTGFCNIDCLYCYLPSRDDRTVMSVDTARQAASFVFDAGLAASDFTVVWHAGEPLVVRPEWYREAIAAMQLAAPGADPIRSPDSLLPSTSPQDCHQYPLRPRILERLRSLGGRAPGRHHVVNEQDTPTR